MSILGNLLWIFLGGGILISLFYMIGGIVLCATIVGIPFGVECFKLAYLALVPFGTPLIWIPATAWLFATGDTRWGIFMGLYGLLVISGVDHPLRPYLISREAHLPFVLVFLGAVGGIVAFGFIGFSKRRWWPRWKPLGWRRLQQSFRRHAPHPRPTRAARIAARRCPGTADSAPPKFPPWRRRKIRRNRFGRPCSG